MGTVETARLRNFNSTIIIFVAQSRIYRDDINKHYNFSVCQEQLFRTQYIIVNLTASH